MFIQAARRNFIILVTFGAMTLLLILMKLYDYITAHCCIISFVVDKMINLIGLLVKYNIYSVREMRFRRIVFTENANKCSDRSIEV